MIIGSTLEYETTFGDVERRQPRAHQPHVWSFRSAAKAKTLVKVHGILSSRDGPMVVEVSLGPNGKRLVWPLRLHEYKEIRNLALARAWDMPFTVKPWISGGGRLRVYFHPWWGISKTDEGDWGRWDRLSKRELARLTIRKLRPYATHRVKLKNAHQIRGGKVALAAAIIEKRGW